MEQLRAAGDNGPQARKLLDALFRKVHNLKATASANGLTSLARAAHEFENVLHALRTGQATLDGNPISAVWNGLKQEQKQAVQQSLAEGAKLFLLQADLEIADFDRQFHSLRETLNRNGEVISTTPSVNKERPGKVNFRILYAANQSPEELSSVTIEELSVVTPTTTNLFAQQMSLLESAFQKFATELTNVKPVATGDVLAQALRAGEAAAQATGKDVEFVVKGNAALLNELPCEPITGALLHLVRNAVDHGIETRGKVIIEITKRDDWITITVSDDGRGIAPSMIDHIFQPGFSTKDEVSNLSGRGVGLDIVKTSIEELGGTVSVHSELGKGSVFQILLRVNPR